jgi:hypothetical protein
MDYFSKFLRTSGQPSPKAQVDPAHEFHNSWNAVKVILNNYPLSPAYPLCFILEYFVDAR